MAESYGNLLKQILVTVADVKARAQSLRAECAAGTAQASAIIQFHDRLQDAKDTVVGLIDRADLNDLVTAHIATGAPADLKAKLAAVGSARDAVVSWLRANFPVSGGYLLAIQFNATTGRTEWRVFTAQQVAGLVTVLDDLIAAAS